MRQKRSKSPSLCLANRQADPASPARFILENNLTPFAFTPNRVTVLQLLASQAAISLEKRGPLF